MDINLKGTLASIISSGGQIVDAQVNLYAQAAAGGKYSLFPVTSEWFSNGFAYISGTWLPDWDESILVDYLYTAPMAEYTPICADITAAVQLWTTQPNTFTSGSTSLLLRGMSPSSPLLKIATEKEAEGLRPLSSLVYRNAMGIEGYWTYTAQNAGVNGTAAVNNFNGNLIVVQDLAGINSARLPVGISLVYNNALLEEAPLYVLSFSIFRMAYQSAYAYRGCRQFDAAGRIRLCIY